MRPSCPPVSIRRTFVDGLVFEEHPAGHSAAHRISLLQPVVFLTLSGRASVDWTDGRSGESHIVNAGRFSLLPANSPYTVRLRTTGATALVSLPCSVAAAGRFGTFPWVHGDEDRQVRELVLALRSIAAAPNGPTTTDGSALGRAFIARLNRRFGTDRSASDLPARSSGLPAVLLAKALRFIEEHLEHPVSVADIASAVGLSESHFARRFKTSMGTPPHRHLMQRRVALGKSLLTQGLSTVDAALRAGFYDQPHFCRCFREVEGTTPSRFIAGLLP